jgi:hypothetical protein
MGFAKQVNKPKDDKPKLGALKSNLPALSLVNKNNILAKKPDALLSAKQTTLDSIDINISSDSEDLKKAAAAPKKLQAVKSPSKDSFDSIDDFDSASAGEIIPKNAAAMNKQPEKDDFDATNSDNNFPLASNSVKSPKHTNSNEPAEPRKLDIHEDLMKEKESIREKYSREVLAYQTEQDLQFQTEAKKMANTLKEKLDKLQADIIEILRKETISINQNLKIEMHQSGPNIIFPPATHTESAAVASIMAAYRVSFENNLVQTCIDLNATFNSKTEFLTHEIKTAYDLELEKLKNKLKSEGDDRIRQESEKILEQIERDIERLQSDARGKYEVEENSMKQELEKNRLLFEQKIREQDSKLTEFEIEMTKKYTRVQDEWKEKFTAIEKNHLEHEERITKLKAHEDIPMLSSKFAQETPDYLKAREADIENQERQLKEDYFQLEKERQDWERERIEELNELSKIKAQLEKSKLEYKNHAPMPKEKFSSKFTMKASNPEYDGMLKLNPESELCDITVDESYSSDPDIDSIQSSSYIKSMKKRIMKEEASLKEAKQFLARQRMQLRGSLEKQPSFPHVFQI